MPAERGVAGWMRDPFGMCFKIAADLSLMRRQTIAAMVAQISRHAWARSVESLLQERPLAQCSDEYSFSFKMQWFIHSSHHFSDTKSALRDA